MTSSVGQKTLVMAVLSVKEVAGLAGVAPSTVRFYEKHGVIEAARTPGNQRRFTENAPCLIKLAKAAQRIGLSIKEIVEVLALLPSAPNSEHWDRVAKALVEEAEARVVELKRQLAALESGDKLCELTTATGRSR